MDFSCPEGSDEAQANPFTAFTRYGRLKRLKRVANFSCYFAKEDDVRVCNNGRELPTGCRNCKRWARKWGNCAPFDPYFGPKTQE